MFRERNQRDFKKGIDRDDARRRREDVAIELRKKTREEQLQKRRQREEPQMPGSENAYLQNSQNAQNGQLGGQLSAGADLQKKMSSEEVQEAVKNIGAIVKSANSNDIQDVFKAVVMLRRMLSVERNPPIQAVIDSGVVPRLVQLLTVVSNPDLQFEAAWTLTNIASGTTAHTQCVVSHNAIPMFVALLASPNQDVREQAVWALGNVAGDSASFRDVVLQAGILQPLLHILTQPDSKLSLVRNGTWALSNLCRGKPQPRFEQISPAIPVLTQLLKGNDVEIQVDACWAFSYISDDQSKENVKIQAILKHGVAPRLVQLLSNGHTNVQIPALRTIGNIVTGDDEQTQAVLNCNPLPALLGTLSRQKKSLRKEACWAISNITAGTNEQIQQVISANIIPPLVALVKDGEFEIQKEAAWALSNITSGGNDEQIRFIVSHGALAGLCTLFNCGESKIMLVALEAVQNILSLGRKDAKGGDNAYCALLEECGGLDLLEGLQRHENEEVYNKSLTILQTYFESEDDEIAPPKQQPDAPLFSFSSSNMPQMPQQFAF